jgi:hypothetical protein
VRVILDLCGGTGSWSMPYREAGYHVITVDPFAEPPGSVREDVRLFRPEGLKVHGVLAAPPCTTFAGSGARWWADKGTDDLLSGLSIVDACLRIIAVTRPAWWVLENPVGRLRHWLGDPVACFDPWQYGDPYTKRTQLWGDFTMPEPTVSARPETDDRIHRAAPGPGRARFRSMTPPGFAQAFSEANP